MKRLIAAWNEERATWSKGDAAMFYGCAIGTVVIVALMYAKVL